MVRSTWRHVQADRNDRPAARVAVQTEGKETSVSHSEKRNAVSGKFRPARMAQRDARCLNEGLGESRVSVKIPSTRRKTERPREPLLQLDIGVRNISLRIGGRL